MCLRLRVEMEHSEWIWWAEGRGGAAERDAVRGEEEYGATGREGRSVLDLSCERGGLVILRLGPFGPKTHRRHRSL